VFEIKSFVNETIPNDIISLYNKWVPHIKTNHYALLENISGFGCIMYGYSYVSKNLTIFPRIQKYILRLQTPNETNPTGQ
jgi:hypothetical protein